MKLIHKAALAAFTLSAGVAFGGPTLGQLGVTDQNKALTRALNGFDEQSLMNTLSNLPEHEAQYLLSQIELIKQVRGTESFQFRNFDVSDPKWTRKDCVVSPQVSDDISKQLFCYEVNPRGANGPEDRRVRDIEVFDMTLEDLVVYRASTSVTYNTPFPISALDAGGKSLTTYIEDVTLNLELELPVSSVTVLDPSPWELTYSIQLTGVNIDTGRTFQLKVETIEPYNTLNYRLTVIQNDTFPMDLATAVDIAMEGIAGINLSPEQRDLFAPLLSSMAATYEA